jgi:hypothetical protein
VPQPNPGRDGDRSLTLHVGSEELVIRQRYEMASVVNDILIALWFLAGSIMFFSPEWQREGTWCFVLGSVELLVRPVIRLSRQVHLRRKRSGGQYAQESGQDF